jgi:alkane 1-monooxygenase
VTCAWYRRVTMIWAPVQIVMIFGLIWFVQTAATLTGWEKLGCSSPWAC